MMRSKLSKWQLKTAPNILLKLEKTVAETSSQEKVPIFKSV